MTHPDSPLAHVESLADAAAASASDTSHPKHSSSEAALTKDTTWNHVQEWWWLWWSNAYLGCTALVLLCTPNPSWLHTARVVILHAYLRLRWALVLFILIAAMTNTVITEIVTKTLSQFGMGSLASTLMIRVMLVELVPIAAALIVAIKLTIPLGAELSGLRHNQHLNLLHDVGLDAYRMEFLPRLLMGIYGVVMFAALGSAVVLLTLYQGIYGFTTAGYDSFTNIFARVMTPFFAFIFAGKAIAFGYIVALIPLTSAFSKTRFGLRRDTELVTLARMLFLIMVAEVLSLVINYY